MNLFVILVLVTLWNLSAADEFFLEIVKPSADAAGLIEDMISRGTRENRLQELRQPEGEGGPHTVGLYSCYFDSGIPIVYSTDCNEIYDPEEKQKIYEVSNFNDVSALKPIPGCTIKINGEYFLGELPQVLTVSIHPVNVMMLLFQRDSENRQYVEHKVNKFLGPFIKDELVSRVQSLVQLFSFNHIGSFYIWTTLCRMLLEPYVAVMKRVMNAVLDKQNTPNTVGSQSTYQSSPQNETPPRPQSPPKAQLPPMAQSPSKVQSSPKVQLQSSSVSSAEYQSRPQPQLQSMSKKKSSFRCVSFFRSTYRSLLPSRPRSRSQSQSQPKSRFWSRPWIFPGPRAKVAPLPEPQSQQFKATSLSRSLPPSRSPSQSNPEPQSFSESDILAATYFLSLKMFDPCSVNWLRFLRMDDAVNYCTVYCRFLSTARHVYGRSFSKPCDDLEAGKCVNGLCQCATPPGIQMGNVNMVFCNNALRLHLYQLLD